MAKKVAGKVVPRKGSKEAAAKMARLSGKPVPKKGSDEAKERMAGLRKKR